jgi:hypothetical protein
LVRNLVRGRVPDVILDRTDKTTFNEAMLADIDYEALTAWLVRTPVEIPGVRYDALARRLEDRDFSVSEYMWAKDLATAHAFLGAYDAEAAA